MSRFIQHYTRSAIYNPAVSLQEERKFASHTLLLGIRIYKKQIAFESNYDSTHGKTSYHYEHSE